MTRAEVLVLFKEIMLEHPKFCEGMTSEAVMQRAELWAAALCERTAEECARATAEVLAENRFDPKLADIVARLEARDEADEPAAIDLWNDLYAVKQSEALYEAAKADEDARCGRSRWDEAEKAYVKTDAEYVGKMLGGIYDTLHPATRRYLGDCWRLLDLADMGAKETEFEKARFLKCIDDLMAREKEARRRTALDAGFMKRLGLTDEKRLGDGDENGT